MKSIQWPSMKDELWRQSGIWTLERPEALQSASVVQNDFCLQEVVADGSNSFNFTHHEDFLLSQMGPTQSLALIDGQYSYQLAVSASALSVSFKIDGKVNIDFQQAMSDQGWQLRVFEFYVAKGAALAITSQVNQPDSQSMVLWLIHQEQDSVLNFSREHIEGAFVRDHVWVNQIGANASSFLHGLYAAHQQQLSEHIWTVSHQAPGGRSVQKLRGILNDNARSVAISQVKVIKGLHGIESEQRLDHILLSDQAAVHTRPQLEILSDDVMCQHGITVGAIDEMALFYLQSRGIDQMLAMQLLARGFFEKIWTGELSELMLEKLAEVIDEAGRHEFSK
jgi:Fe-S cluster assembly scaffold protein SufB